MDNIAGNEGLPYRNIISPLFRVDKSKNECAAHQRTPLGARVQDAFLSLFLSCKRILSAIIAMNSELVGLSFVN